MDLFDLIPVPTGSGRQRSGGEELASLLAVLVFPVLDFLLVAEVLSPTSSSVVPGILLPASFAGATYLAGRALGGRMWVSVAMALLCAATCFIASAAGTVFALF